MSASFELIWKQIVQLSGSEFRTKTGKPFTYKLMGNSVCTSRTDYNISRSSFEQAFAVMPIDGPGALTNIVRGPSYVWAILNDSRILGTQKETE